MAIQGTKASVISGFSARPGQLPCRQLELLCPLPSGQTPPDRLGASPWLLDQTAVDAASPLPRDFSAAWLLQQDPQCNQALPLAEWVDLVAGKVDHRLLAACWLWLQGPQLFYRRRQGLVEPRSPLELKRLRQERRRQRLLEQEQLLWHQDLRRRQPLNSGLLGSAAQADLAKLLAWASGDDHEPLPLGLRQALQAAHCPIDRGGIRHLLVDLGQWDLHGLPSLRQTTWELGFSAELEAEAHRLVDSESHEHPGDPGRLDLSHLWAVTIDDEDTRDIDDGLSLEQARDGVPRIWIHVADPGRLVSADSPLDLEARRRGSSLYLARGHLPMFPLALSAGPFSLRVGHRNAAWSLWVELDDEGAITSSGLQRSWVRPTYRLTYSDADDLIELAPPQEVQLGILQALMHRRRQWRERHGALLMDQAEGRIRLCDGQPELEITEPGPARSLVAEAMILAGAVVADHGRRHGLALPYRSQLPATLPSASELACLPVGPVRHAALKRCLSRGITGTEPARHFSLGLDAYVQATSPIRRYGDLIVQRQLAAQVDAVEPMAAEQLMALLAELDIGVRQGQAISREDQRHWQQIWFELHRHGHWQAVFLRWLRPQDRLGLVHVEALAMDLAAECPQAAEPGTQLLLRVLEVDGLRDVLRLRATS